MDHAVRGKQQIGHRPLSRHDDPNMLTRRILCAALAVAVPVAAPTAQTTGRIWRLGVLRPSAVVDWDHLRPALRALGYSPGQNLVIYERFADGDISRLPALARELVEADSDVLIAVGAAATRAVRDVSRAIPTVMFGNFDPVAAGFAASLARPGDNITGIMISSEGTLAAKKIELLQEAVSGLRRLGVLTPDNPNAAHQLDEVRTAAFALGVTLVVAEVRRGAYDQAFAALAAGGVEALLVAADQLFLRDRMTIISHALQLRVPAIYEWPDQVRDGGFMAYGPSFEGLWQRIALYVDRILKGAKAGDLPIELPTTLDLAINLRTARAMGFTVPPVLLARATEIIE
ncbi:MAG: ABC transporter substrate-binding protein [Reyranella sp.]|nr:ABC transporter substrate-binding protein [Reyranella sp.]